MAVVCEQCAQPFFHDLKIAVVPFLQVFVDPSRECHPLSSPKGTKPDGAHLRTGRRIFQNGTYLREPDVPLT